MIQHELNVSAGPRVSPACFDAISPNVAHGAGLFRSASSVWFRPAAY
jgi:hypothetical protein